MTAPVAQPKAGFTGYLSSQLLRRVFSSAGWPEWLGGIFLGVINVLFFAWANKPFSIYTGFKNLGLHLYNLLGITGIGGPKPILAEKTTVGDIGLFLGALIAAVLANEFRIRFSPRKIDYAEAALGGALMATGVVFAVGCNWGGFFSAITALSLHGYLMFPGLLLGGLAGAYYVRWRADRELARLELGAGFGEVSIHRHEAGSSNGGVRRGLLALGVVLTALIALATLATPGGELFFVILLFGLLVGIVIQRSRFCFATAFRDVLAGGGEFDRSVRLQFGILAGILVGASGTALLKYMGVIDPYIYVKPAGLINIFGGFLFGLGMVLAGSCASGSLWRAAEGHIRLWVALIAAVLLYAPLRALLGATVLPSLLGPKILLTEALGWAGGLLFIYVTSAVWALFLLYLSYRRGR